MTLPVSADDTPQTPVPSPVPNPTPAPPTVPETSPDPGLPDFELPLPPDMQPLDNDKGQKPDQDKDEHRKKPTAQQYKGNSAGRWLGPLFDNVYVSGGTSLTARSYSVSGSASGQAAYKDQFDSQNYGTQQVGPFQQNMDLTVQGRVLNAFTINGRFTNQRYGNYFNQVFGFNYKAKGTTFDVGDVSASLPGNEFVSFARTVRGLDFGRDFGNGMHLQGIGSYTRSVSQRGTFQGNGTRGPYSLASSSLIEGTEHVRLNDQDLVAGQDYQIDYSLGQITFINGRIINPEDTVVYTYEAQNFNSSTGLLTGLRYDLAPKEGKYSMGLTWLQQKTLDANRGDTEITERFPVDADITYQYALAAGIQANTIVTVKYKDTLLVENTDYTLNRASRYIRLLVKYPADSSTDPVPTSSLSVTYTPVRQASVNGDRSVMGLDGAYRVTPSSSLSWQYGRSQNATDSTKTGDALSLAATFGGGKSGPGTWNGTLNWRDVGSTFAGIDSTSSAFLQAEKGLRGTFNIRPTSFLTVSSSMRQSRIGTSSTTTNTDGTSTTSYTWNNSTQYQGSASISIPRWPRLDLSHSQTDQKVQSTSGTTSHYQSDQLNLNYQIGMLGVTGAIGRTVSHGTSVYALSNSSTTSTDVSTIINGTTTTSSTGTDSASDTARLTLSLNPASWVSMTGAVGLSRTKYGSTGSVGTPGSTSDARDNSFGIRLPVRQNLSFGFDWSDSSNGQTTSQSANGVDSNGNPITSTQTGSGISSQRTQTTNYDVHYQPIERLDLSVTIGKTLYLIPGYDNTDSQNFQLTTTYTPYPILTLFGTFSTQRVTYLANQTGGSDDKTYQLTSTLGPLSEATGTLRHLFHPFIRPLGKMTFTSSWQYIKTGSALSTSTTTSTDLIGTGTTTTTTTSSTSQQQNLTLWSVRGDYPIGGNKSLYLQWQTTDSRSPLASSSSTSSSYYTSSDYQRGVTSLGFDMRFSQLLGFTFSWSLTDMRDREQGSLSYRAQAFNSSLSAQF